MIFRILAKLIPRTLRMQIKNFKTLAIVFGQWRSIREKMPIDGQGKPIPWYTYPAIEYLKQLNLIDKNVFEWGSGNSSLFWAGRAKSVVSIESDKNWFNEVNKKKLDNQLVNLIEKKNNYIC